ncbi:MAG TPA: hypothetical protein VN723_04465 [Rhizomicrobium sp.]|nr:hypothetical protein [Rhizomicrobium sp.]
MTDLVPGRECGDCTVCCTVPTIDQPGIRKRAGATCRHCDHGCRIHDTRPEVCRQYFCAWRRMEIFSEDWRPDRCGVFSELESDVPEHLMSSVGISLTLTGNPLKTIRRPWFIDFIATGIRGGVPLFLALPGPSGYKGAKVSLNTLEMARAASGARADVKALLEKALAVLNRYDFKLYVMQHQGNDVGVAPD